METTPRESKQIDLWISEFITFGAATVFIGLRLLSRRLTRIEFWWDDWFAIGCYVSRRLYMSLTSEHYTNFIKAVAIAWVVIIPICTSKSRYSIRPNLTSTRDQRCRTWTSHQRHSWSRDQGGNIDAQQSHPLRCRIVLRYCSLLRQRIDLELLLAHVPSHQHQASHSDLGLLFTDLDYHSSEYARSHMLGERF